MVPSARSSRSKRTTSAGPIAGRERQPDWSELEYQFQNWYHFNWLSGDQTAQQLIHSIDKGSWALGDVPPVKAWGLGGRQVCLETKYGDQFDHFSVVFEYANGVRMFGYCRDIPGCGFNSTTDIILGTKGQAFMPDRCHIEGENPWHAEKSAASMYDVEHKELFESIRQGQPINNGHYMVLSSLLAILAQMVCYTGEEITWEQLMGSTAQLRPSQVLLGRGTTGETQRGRHLRSPLAGRDQVRLTSTAVRNSFRAQRCSACRHAHHVAVERSEFRSTCSGPGAVAMRHRTTCFPGIRVLLAVATVSLVLTPCAAGERRLIATGWDSPTPARFRDELAAFEAWQAFDGTTIAATRKLPDGRVVDARNAFGREPWQWSEFAAALADLQAVKPVSATENFLFAYANPGDVDWFDDAGWSQIVDHWRCWRDSPGRQACGESCTTPNRTRPLTRSFCIAPSRGRTSIRLPNMKRKPGSADAKSCRRWLTSILTSRS